MRRFALLLPVFTACTFDASGFGAAPVDTSAAPMTDTGGGPGTSEGSGVTAEVTGEAGSGSASASGSTGETTQGATSGPGTTGPGTTGPGTTGPGTTGPGTTGPETTGPGTTTEAMSTGQPCETMMVWVDADGDGFGDPNMPQEVCAGEWQGVAPNGDDCNDMSPAVGPNKPEICDKLDNDCDGNVDNIDAGGDGICDCLNIGILGNSGFAPNANFEAWLEDQGSSVTRTLLLNKPGVVTPAFLAAYDLVLIDRIERALSAEEAAALEAFVKTSGRGLITLIGYNFDNNNPGPERDRANTALTPFGLAYQGGYFGNAVIPTFDQNHPVSMGIMDVNFAGGIEPVDLGKQGQSDIFSTWQGKTCGIAHQTAMMGGRVIVWGDEWLTFDSDWQGYADVQDFWVNMVDWARPQDFCGVPQ